MKVLSRSQGHMRAASSPLPGGPVRNSACTWPPAERSVLTRPATLASMSISCAPSGFCGSVLMAGVKASLLLPLQGTVETSGAVRQAALLAFSSAVTNQ